MKDLISREAVVEALRARGMELLKMGIQIASVTAYECVNIVKDAPAVDAEPVRHGRWIERDGKTWCNLCCKPNKAYMPPFCPHCGAKMDGDSDG